MKYWYSHLVEIDSIMIGLEQLDLSTQEKLHLAKLADSSLQHTILDMVLSQLSKEDKVKLISYLKKDDHNQIWKFLNEKVDDIEEKVKKTAKDLKEVLICDLKEAKRLK